MTSKPTKIYRVTVREVHAYPYRVAATSREDAVRQVLENCNGVQHDDDLDNWESYIETVDVPDNPMRVEVLNSKTSEFEEVEK